MGSSLDLLTALAQSSLVQQLNLAWIVAGAFVVVHAVARFNSPPTSRTETTLGRYSAAAAVYAFVSVCLWLFLTSSPQTLSGVLSDTGRGIPAAVENSLPFVAALVVTALLPHVDWLAALDSKVRVFLCDLASIPAEAVRLTKVLRGSPINPEDRVRIEIERLLQVEGFATKDIAFDVAGPQAQCLWTKIRTILYWFREWKGDRRFSTFRRTFSDTFTDLEQRYEDLTPVAREVFRLEDADIKDAGAAASIRRLRQGFLVNAGSLERDMCRLVSRAALTCMVRESARNAGLAEMGFRADVATYPLFDRLVGLFGFLGVWYATILIMARPGDWSVVQAILLGVGIASLSCIAVFWAIWLKRYRFARPSRTGRPVASYFLSAGGAMLASFLLTWGLHVIVATSVSESLDRQGITWPWMLMAGVTAFMTAFLADDRPTDVPLLGDWLRWLEAGAFSLAGPRTGSEKSPGARPKASAALISAIAAIARGFSPFSLSQRGENLRAS